MNTIPTIEDIEAARNRLPDYVHSTPLAGSHALSQLVGVPVYLKLEHQQNTGSFKLRGASNAITQLDDKQKAVGIVGVSTGNHGRGLAYAAKRANINVKIFMSELVPEIKVNAVRDLGAKIIIADKFQDETEVSPWVIAN